MLSYRKLAMRVLGRPLHTGGGIDSPRPASQRAAAFILTAAMLTTLAAPAFAETWDIEKGDITVKAGETGNDVTQNNKTTYGDTGTVITGKSDKNTVTINAEDKNDKVEVTLKDVNIDASSRSEAAVSVTGKGDTTIELDGDNELKSGAGHAGLEHNKTDTSGELTIQDKDNNGSLEAAGGFKGAGIGSAGSNDAQVKITGGNITATTSDDWGAGIGSGSYGTGTVEITGGEMAHQVMECSGANILIRQSLDMVCHAGRITFTGWPKKETSLPTDLITKKEIDIRGARTSAGEFEEAIELICSGKVDVKKILTKTVSLEEAPETVIDIEKNPGNYMKVVVKVD